MTATRPRRWRRIGATAAIVALALSAAGCSSDSDGAPSTTEGRSTTSAPTGGSTTTTGATTTTVDLAAVDRSDYEAAVAAAWATSGYDAKAGPCISKGVVDRLGVDRLKAAGVAPGAFGFSTEAFAPLHLDAQQATALYGVFGDCKVDLAAATAEQMKEVDDATATCYREHLTADVVEQSMVALFRGSDTRYALLNDALEPCFAAP